MRASVKVAAGISALHPLSEACGSWGGGPNRRGGAVGRWAAFAGVLASVPGRAGGGWLVESGRGAKFLRQIWRFEIPLPATSLSPSAVACDLLSGPGVGASWWPARGPGETLAGPAGPAAATPKGAAFLHGGAAEVPCFHPDPPCPGENLISSRIWRRRRLAHRDLAGGAVREAGCGREALQVRDGAASSSSSDSTKRIST